MVSRFERFSFVISEIYRHLHKIMADEMEKYGLKGAYAIYLSAMYRHPDGITATELGEICSRNKADVSRAMSSMQRSTTPYHWHRSVSVGTSDGANVRPSVSSSHFADINGDASMSVGFSIAMVLSLK